MCTSITARWHAGFQDGGAFIILTRQEGNEKGGEREVRIRGVGQSKLGSRLGCWVRVDGVDKAIQDKEIFSGVKLHGSSCATEEISLPFTDLAFVRGYLRNNALCG